MFSTGHQATSGYFWLGLRLVHLAAIVVCFPGTAAFELAAGWDLGKGAIVTVHSNADVGFWDFGNPESFDQLGKTG